MGKKFNYFDDELEPPKRSERQLAALLEQDEPVKKVINKVTEKKPQKPKFSLDTSFFKKLLKVLKYILSTLGVYALLGAKKFGKLVKRSSETRASRVKGVITVIISLVLVVVIVISSFLISAKKVNKKHSEYMADAYKVCIDYTKKYGNSNYKYMNSQYNVKGFMLTGLCVAREMDFNNDGTSELLIVYNSGDTYYTDVWAYNDGKLSKIFAKEIAASKNRNDDIWMSIYSKGQESFIACHNKDDLSSVTIYEMHSDEFRKKNNATYDQQSKQFKIRNKDVTDNFERIIFSPLREHTAAKLTESCIDTVDSFSGSSTSKSKNLVSNGNMNLAYYKIIEEYNKNYGVAKVEKAKNDDYYYINGLAVVDLIDFDGDNNKELLLIYRRGVNERSEDSRGNYISILKYQYYCEIYTYNGSVAKRVFQSDNISNMLKSNNTYYYLTMNEGNKTYYCQNSFTNSNYGNYITASSKIFKFDGNQFEQEFKSSYQTNYGYTEYYIDGERSYRSSFADKGGYKVAMFDGKEEYDSSVWSISYVQAPKSKQQYLNSQVTKTEEIIKTMDSSYNPNSAAQ